MKKVIRCPDCEITLSEKVSNTLDSEWMECPNCGLSEFDIEKRRADIMEDKKTYEKLMKGQCNCERYSFFLYKDSKGVVIAQCQGCGKLTSVEQLLWSPV